MKSKLLLLMIGLGFFLSGFAQIAMDETTLKFQKDSAFKAMVHADSLKLETYYSGIAHWDKLKAMSIFPVINAGEFSGVIPVKNQTEIPDPKMDFKLLFEVTVNNADSLAKNVNASLVEVARLINLHAASGIPLKKIIPVIVVHGGALNAISSNEHYHKKYHMDNPNLKVLADLEKLGTRVIACGQAMAFLSFQREDLLPQVKVSLTAQTVLSNYQLKGYVLYEIDPEKH